MKKTLITFSLLLATSVVVFSQTLLSKDEFKTQRFGQEILYKDLQNGLLDGHYKIADSRGNYSDLYFKQGKKDGKNIDYDYKGRVLKTVTYKNGKAEGNYVTYHQNGKIRKQGAFNKGEEEGKWQVFNDKGELKTVESYKNGKKHGKGGEKYIMASFNLMQK